MAIPSILMIIFLIFSNIVSPEVVDYQIVPNKSLKLCTQNRESKCLTLEQFASLAYEQTNTSLTLFFQPGTHLLSKKIPLENLAHVLLSGNRSVMRFEQSGGLILRNMSSVEFSQLTIKGGGNTIMNFSSVKRILINNCTVQNQVGTRIAIQISKSLSVFMLGNIFINNTITGISLNVQRGIISIVNTCNVTITGSNFSNNQISGLTEINGGVLHLRRIRNVMISKSTFNRNKINSGNDVNGGVVFLQRIDYFEISNSTFHSNIACGLHSQCYGYGGALYIETMEHGFYSYTHNNFLDNRADNGGAIFEILTDIGSCQSSGNNFSFNSATYRGGAVCTLFRGSASYFSSDNLFRSNNAHDGGAIYFNSIHHATYHSTQDMFLNNLATGGGGSIYARLDEYGRYYNSHNKFESNVAMDIGGAISMELYWHSKARISNNQYFSNEAGGGGAINIFHERGNMHAFCQSSNNIFINNSVTYYGGAVKLIHGRYLSENDTFVGNDALIGGGLAVFQDSTEIQHAIFLYNQAKLTGAVVYSTDGDIRISNCTFEQNLLHIGIVSVLEGKITINGSAFLHNRGKTLYVLDSEVDLCGSNIFTNNTQGGAIVSTQSTITFRKESEIKISGNEAETGGGLYLRESQAHIYCSMSLTDNIGSRGGGGLYAYQSVIIFKSQQLMISGNRALSKQAGGVSLIASIFKISDGNVTFSENSGVDGGAMFIEQNSRLYIYNVSFTPDDIAIGRVKFINNSANRGGAIFAVDSMAAGTVCKGRDDHQEDFQSECFLQTLTFDRTINLDDSDHVGHGHDFTFVLFLDNRARFAGNDIYGGLLDRCTPSVEALIRNISGLDYIRTLSYFGGNRTNGMILTKDELDARFASDVVRVCFCDDKNTYNCNDTNKNIFVRRGRVFYVRITAVNQIQTQMAASVLAEFSLNSSIGRFKEEQAKRQINSTCTVLEYNVYSAKPSVQIDLYADGPCGNRGISKRTVSVNFVPCKCPIGFQPSDSTVECICECAEALKALANCSQDEMIRLSHKIWVGFVNASVNNTGLILHSCPFDYCLENPIKISLSTPNDADRQCDYNRSNLLCGECKAGLSQVLGSSRCRKCTNYYLVLIIPFAILGVMLVAFILVLNLTVATGTIHGLIFYANAIGSASPIYFSRQEIVPIKVFISWLNLDLGIETCFYEGMDSNAKVLLQFAFPSYLIFLTIIIIVTSEHSRKFAALLANRNPVSTLSTLILLSYSKLLRTTISALQYTPLELPDGTYKIVWLFDANIPYFGTSQRIILFISAFIIIVLGVIYTVLLLFGQWLQKLSNVRLLKWIKHPKYNAFIDAYQAPFVPKHRYWVGLLLLTRIIQNVAEALILEESVTILCVICLAIALVTLKIFNTKTYKEWLLDMLESLFLINIIVVSAGTYHVRESGGNQLALITTSISITILSFLGILGHHMYFYLLKGTKIWTKISWVFVRKQSRYYELLTAANESSDDDSAVIEVPQEYLPRNEPQSYTDTVDTTSSREGLTPRYDPPIIRSALIVDQLREPALDILDPVTEAHYRGVMKKYSSPSLKKVTSQIVEL